MERTFYIGITIGFFISGVLAILIAISQQLGFALIVLSIILGFLFINPKSPVKRKWWSISGRLGIVCVTKVGVSNEYLTINTGLRALSVVQVEKIVLKIGRKQLSSDWKAIRVEADECKYVNFKRPNWLHAGDYKAYLIAYTPNGFSKSNQISLRIDK